MKIGDFVKFKFVGELQEGYISSIKRANHKGKYYTLYMIRTHNGTTLPCQEENFIK
jgi:hypothetical protein